MQGQHDACNLETLSLQQQMERRVCLQVNKLCVKFKFYNLHLHSMYFVMSICQ